MGGFKRSGTFGIVGVIVVMAACAVVGITLGSGQARPTLALALIFGIVGLYVLILFVLQARDLSRAEEGTVPDAAEQAAARAKLSDPTTLGEPELWAALALGPIDAEAARARGEIWGTARASLRLGWIITPLIFAGVVPIYLLDTFVPFAICTPLIVLLALWKSVSLLRGGGELDASYERVGIAMRPLGLDLVERPTVWFTGRLDRPLFSPDFAGALVLAGERHGRPVSVCFPAGGQGVRAPSAVTLGGAVPELEASFVDGRLRARRGGPPQAGRSLGAMTASPRWKGVKIEGGPEGLIIYRRSSKEGDWLCDLWLAERLAAALDGAAASSRS